MLKVESKHAMEICPKCERPVKSKNAWHYCAKVDIDDLFIGRSEEMILIFDKILAEVMDWEGVNVSASKNCVIFVRNKTFLIVRPLQKVLDLKFYLPEETNTYPVFKCKPYNNKFEIHIRLNQLEDLDYSVFELVGEAYLQS